MSQKINLTVLTDKFLKEGLKAGFTLTGIEYYNSSDDSKIEFYCQKDKKFIVRPWATWKRCFGHNNAKFRPVCCYEREKGMPFICIRSNNTMSDSSMFPTGEADSLSITAGFNKEEKEGIVAKLANPSKNEAREIIKIPTGDKARINFVETHARRVNATIIKIEALNTKSKIFMRCNSCGVESQGTMLKNMAGIQKLRCCENKSRQVGMSATFATKLIDRNHQIVGPNPESRCGPVKIYCMKHDQVHNTSRDSYEKGVTGLPCCGNERQVKARESHVSTAAPRRRGHTQWRNKVLANSRVCFLTGFGQNVQAHHLFSVVAYPKLANNPLNGVVLDGALHRKFHSWHGQNDSCTAEDLCFFLSFISDRNNTEGKVFFDSIRDLQLVNLEVKLQELRAVGETLTKLL